MANGTPGKLVSSTARPNACGTPHAVMEPALAHRTKDKAEAAYARSDLPTPDRNQFLGEVVGEVEGAAEEIGARVL